MWTFYHSPFSVSSVQESIRTHHRISMQENFSLNYFILVAFKIIDMSSASTRLDSLYIPSADRMSEEA